MEKRSVKEKMQRWLVKIGIKRRQAYLRKKRKQLKNPNPTIICNNCVGGVVYHDLGLQFHSPTVNLTIQANHFVRFVQRLEEYLQCEPVEVFDESVSCPVGELRLEDEFIRIYFVHYETFQDAKEKWIERCKRIDLNNVYIVFLHRVKTYPTTRLYKAFRALPYKNKVMLTFPVGIIDRRVVPFFSNKLKDVPGLILKYPHVYSKKRYIDRCNFVKFLNRGHK